MLQLDHLALTCTDLALGTAHAEAALGVSFQPGGQHLRFGTQNALLGLEDGVYLEVIAPDPGLPKPPVCWFGLGQFSGPPRLGNWICRTDDINAALAVAPPEAGQAIDMERGDLRWEIAVPPDGSLPLQGGWPTLMAWAPGTVHPAARLVQRGVRLRRLTILHPRADWLRAQLSTYLADDRIAFETADMPALSASFSTPSGERTLT